MMNQKKINAHRERFGKRMVKFDFDKFFDENDVTVEALAVHLNYTLGGVMKMMRRGTMKPRCVDLLRALRLVHHKDIDKYVRKK